MDTEHPNSAAEAAATEAVTWSEKDFHDVLRSVVDPELHMNIVDIGLIYAVRQDGDTVHIDLTMTSPGCPYAPYILHQVREILLTMRGIEHVDLNLVWEPPWTPARMTEEARLELGFDV